MVGSFIVQIENTVYDFGKISVTEQLGLTACISSAFQHHPRHKQGNAPYGVAYSKKAQDNSCAFCW